MQVTFQQPPQWFVVEQGLRVADPETSRNQRAQPVQARLQHRSRVGAIDLLRAEIRPDPLQVSHRVSKQPCTGRKHDGIDRTGRCAADDGKGVRRAPGHQLGDRLQHADLVGAAGAAARQHEPDVARPARFRSCRFLATHRFGMVTSPRPLRQRRTSQRANILASRSEKRIQG